jgi:hypothetical protein
MNFFKFKVDVNHMTPGFCVYNANDYSLEYEIYTEQKKTMCRKILLIYDTLTVVFDATSRKFISLDDYTNIDQWQKKDFIHLPEIDCTGTLIIEDGFEDDDRYSYRIRPFYNYSKDIINIILIDKDIPFSKFCTISDNLIVGIFNNNITSCYVLNTTFI